MMRYIVQRPLKHGGNTLEPGEELPEAATWRNLGAYLASGHIVAVPESGVQNARVEDLERRLAFVEEQLGISAQDSENAGEWSGEATGNPDPDEPDSEDTVTGFLDAGELEKLTRPQLEEMAKDLGIEKPDDKATYPKKDDLIAVMVTIPVDAPAKDEEPESSEGSE